MALLSSRSDGRDYAKGALEPNVAGDQWSEKQNTGDGAWFGGGIMLMCETAAARMCLEVVL